VVLPNTNKGYTPESNVDWQWLPRRIVHNSMMRLQQNTYRITTQQAHFIPPGLPSWTFACTVSSQQIGFYFLVFP